MVSMFNPMGFAMILRLRGQRRVTCNKLVRRGNGRPNRPVANVNQADLEL